MAIKLKCCYAQFMDQIVAPETSKGEIKTRNTLITTLRWIRFESNFQKEKLKTKEATQRAFH